MAGAVDNAGQVIGGVAIAVVGLSVVLFSLVGFVRADEGQADVVTSPSITDVPSPSPTDTGSESTAATPTAEPETSAPTPAPEPTPSPEPTQQPSPSPVPSPEPPSPSPQAPTVDPATVSVQVLDADGVPGDASVDRAVADITAAGYRVAARNDASITYDVTTVLWTAGNETAARELAATLGYREVREKPDNLSPSVSLHVVVGRDLVP